MHKLIIGLSGRKLAGKSSGGKFIFCEFVNRKIGKKRLILEKIGKEILILDTFKNNSVLVVDQPTEEASLLNSTYSVKMYSFADPLKEFCINVLGLDKNQCYGSDEDKNTPTHILWDDMPLEIREKYSKPKRGKATMKLASGPMTGRNVMQVFGTEICRKMDENCWARGLLNTIEKEGCELAIITDVRFPNEVSMTTERGGKVVRLTRHHAQDTHDSEKALDNFPLGEFTLLIDNQEKTLSETHKILLPYLNDWFDRYKI